MQLILWRHALTLEGPPDADLDLSDEGRAQARKVAAWLVARLAPDTRIVVGPERRTQQTAAALGLPFETVKALDGRAIAPDILDISSWPEGTRDVLVVGNQPALGEVAAILMLNESQPISMRKGSVWWFTSRDRDNFATTFVRAVIVPDMV